jgi:putative cell wall-binding protein
MRFRRPRNRRAALLGPLAMVTTIALSTGILGVATPAFAGGAPGSAIMLVASVATDFVAGTPQTVTVSAEDADGNVDPTWNGSAHLFTTAAATYPDGIDGVAMIAGTGTVSVEFDTPGDPIIDPIDDGGVLVTTGISVTVDAVATHLVLTSNPPSIWIAGEQGTLTLTAEDADGNVATTLDDTVSVYDDDAGVTLGGQEFSTRVALVNGTATLVATLDAAGDQDVYAATDGGLTGDFEVPVIAAPAALLNFELFNNSLVAGTPYTFTLYAVDAFDNVTDMPDQVQLTWLGITADPSNPVTADFVDGVATITGTYDATGFGELDVSDADDPELTGDAFIDVAAAALSGGGSGHVAVAVPVTSDRLAGVDRFATATAISAMEFPAHGSAGAVVLTRSDDASDSTVGAVLAAAKNAPLLFTTGGSLPSETAAEITRVIPAGGTVYLLGGTGAIPASVPAQLSTLGFAVVRLAGADRYSTAVAVAEAIGGTGPVFLATGTGFADALSAGPAAAHGHGVVLLTDGGTLPASVIGYLAAHIGKVFAVGGQAAAADSSATAVIGADRYATAAAVATTFFTAPTNVGIASGTTFADALSGGAYLAHLDGPLLLTPPSSLSASAHAYLGANVASTKAAFTFGGTAAISSSAKTQIDASLGN